ALTVIFALFGSLVLSMTLMPVLASLLLPQRLTEREPLVMRMAHAIHTPILNFAMRFQGTVLAVAAAVLVVAFGILAPSLGTEFVPTLSEGAIEISLVRQADTPIERSIAENTRLEQAILKAFPDEIQHVWCRIGSAEIATDPMGVELTDFFISLKPRRHWQKATAQDGLVELMERELRPFLGTKFAFSQPIKERLDEMDT